MNFGGIAPAFTVYKKAAFVVIPVPYDLTSTYQSGSRRGPGAILEASGNMELYDEELRKETYRSGIHTLPPLESDARGPAEMVDSVRRTISRVAADGKIPVMLGGEHSISFGAVQAMKEIYPEITVLQLDAHADLRDSYQGTPYSHASVARRITGVCPLIQAGIRSLSVEEAEFMEEGRVRTHTADFILDGGAWWETICGDLHGDLYLTVDLDVLDPAVMPSTGTPEPGGLAWRDLLRLVREAAKRCRIRGFDVVELAPIPGVVAPDFLAAKLVYRIMGYLTEKN
ncbi:MAG: agmatinase [Proteobacteria bacterium]|nr:agmatinase [Pseudomonadota bacterium]MBU1965324.1 agmatinase [Pseudomonadota bacterium]